MPCWLGGASLLVADWTPKSKKETGSESGLQCTGEKVLVRVGIQPVEDVSVYAQAVDSFLARLELRSSASLVCRTCDTKD